MNTPETINIEKYAEALNNLVGMDIGYLGESDENVNAIVEVIKAAKALEQRVEELTIELKAMRGAANSYKIHNKALEKEKVELWEERNRIYDDLQDWKELTEGYRKMFEDCYAEKDALIKNYAQCMKDYARDIFDEIGHIGATSHNIVLNPWEFIELKKKYVEGEV